MGNNKKVTCSKCLRIMRSDNIRRHTKQHEKDKFEKESLFSSSISTSRSPLQEETERELSVDTTNKTYEELVIKRLKKNNDKYMQDMELGKIIAKAIKDGKIAQDSLCSEDSDALHLYWNKKQLMNIDNIIIKHWQSALLNYMKPSYREVIWVQGAKCDEGKTFFQEYIEAKFGWKRVMCGLDIMMKKESIFHTIRSRPYMTTDIFTFNIGKDNTNMEDINYQVLEQIKDGRFVAAKFSSKEIKICKPNIVIVFSNDKPELKKLAMDRWTIFKIKDNDLIDVSPKSK